MNTNNNINVSVNNKLLLTDQSPMQVLVQGLNNSIQKTDLGYDRKQDMFVQKGLKEIKDLTNKNKKERPVNKKKDKIVKNKDKELSVTKKPRVPKAPVRSSSRENNNAEKSVNKTSVSMNSNLNTSQPNNTSTLSVDRSHSAQGHGSQSKPPVPKKSN